MNTKNVEVNYDFGFDFIDDNDNQKVLIWINDHVVISGDEQYCIFTLESDNVEPSRIRVLPDFVNEHCDIVARLDSKVEDYDIQQDGTVIVMQLQHFKWR